MFNRIYHEFQFQTLRLTDHILTDNENLVNTTTTSASNSCEKTTLSSDESLNQNDNEALETKLKFTDIINKYDEKFIMVTQTQSKTLFVDFKMNDLLHLFTVSICARFDGKTRCSKDCDCKTSFDIGSNLYEKGGVHSFYQIGNYIVGSIVEQHTDPLTRIAIKFDSSMHVIKTIYCPCKLYFCPHAVSLLLFRIKLKNFYAIKLPEEMFNKNISQSELVKFYGFFVEESRSLPIIKDYHSRCWTSEQSIKQKHLQIPFIYAYCHKNLLPIDFAILEEQTRARKWISDLYMKRNSQSLSGMTPLPNAGEIFLLGDSINSKLNESTSSSSSRLKNSNNGNKNSSNKNSR